MTYAFIRRAAAIAASSCLMATAASAASWSFSQSYGTDGIVSGTFTGSDLNSDGLITYIDGLGNELQGITLSFSGPAFTGSFGQAEMIIGGIDSTVTEFQYVVGALNMDAVIAGPPEKRSIVTLSSPLLPSGATNGQDALVFWTAGSASFGPNGNPDKGWLDIITPNDPNSLFAGQFQTIAQVVIAPAAPIPEPATYLMLAAGVAVVGSAARRRARAGV